MKGRKFGRMCVCQNQSSTVVWRRPIPFPVFAPGNGSKDSSASPVCGSSPSFGGEKTVCGTCGTVPYCGYDRRHRRVWDWPCADPRIDLDLEVRRVDCRRGGAVKRERLDFWVENALHTKRFAL